MKHLVSIMVIFVLILALPTDSQAQLRKRTTSKTSKTNKEKASDNETRFLDKTYAELKFGNLGFFNGLYISSKLDVGYKVHDRFSFGGGTKLFFNQQVRQNAPDPSIFDIGGFVHARAKITTDIYFQAEYAFMKYGKDPDGYIYRGFSTAQNVNYPLFGLGYMSGTDKWRFGIELLYIANEKARDYQGSIVEYWFGASYNF
ncbi:MAG: hypothetical protein IPG00_03310 [Saprospiraceae bacterium]|nr:hypothetical protein [Saprospiraceae bacterium]